MAIIKPKVISGFPEYGPDIQYTAQKLLNDIRAAFELHGFVGIETPIIERLEVLLSKSGDSDKEMYVLDRYQGSADKQPEYGLRYDLTVPFARYVAAHFSDIHFPFKRYQIQDCWRGERPQEGRYRQFRQCDVDIVALDKLPLSFDVEIPLVVMGVLKSLPMEQYEFRISNRNILDGYVAGLGIEQSQEVRRALDKLDKIGRESVCELLGELGVSGDQAEQLLRIGTIKTRDLSFVDEVRSLGVENDTLSQGLEDLEYVAKRCLAVYPEDFYVDLSVTRGFDYYTGTVYEVSWNQYPELGSIAGGGRYEDLAGTYINKKLPGVGMSVGFSRIFGKLVKEGVLQEETEGVTTVLIARLDEESDTKAQKIANELRLRGISTEVYWDTDKLKKQLQYANRKRIPFIVFDESDEIKDLRSGEQTPFNPSTWCP